MIAVQPSGYFPPLAFFALAHRARCLVVGDTFQYSRQSFQNRARIPTPDGTMWLTVPLIGGQHGRGIGAVQLDARRDWRRHHRKALRFNYGAAPFYAEYAPRIEALLAPDYATLGALTGATVLFLAEGLGVADKLAFASHLPGSPATRAGVEQAFPEGTPFLTAAAPPGWHEAPRHQAFPGPFTPGCSALDALLFYGPDARRFL